MDKKAKEFVAEVLRRIISGENVSREETKQCLIYLLERKLEVANDVCFGAFFSALQTKKPTIEETVGLMDAVMYFDRQSIEINRDFSEPLCGIIGSGKDELKTFNVSSIASVVAAASGAKVLKNGSRAEASIAGTTDVFEALGANVLSKDCKVLEKSINTINFGFCDAEPFFPKMVKEYLGKFFFVHPLSYILPVASGLKFDRVVFGLANNNTELTAELLRMMGYDNSIVVAGHNERGQVFDEISNIGFTKITEIKNGHIRTYTIEPADLGIKKARYRDIKEGSSLQENVIIFKNIVTGKDSGPRRDIVLINAAAVLYISGKVSSIKNGIPLALLALKNGQAKHTLEKFIELSKGSNSL